MTTKAPLDYRKTTLKLTDDKQHEKQTTVEIK